MALYYKTLGDTRVLALGALHIGYENAAKFPLQAVETQVAGRKFSFRVEKMKFNAQRTQLQRLIGALPPFNAAAASATRFFKTLNK